MATEPTIIHAACDRARITQRSRVDTDWHNAVPTQAWRVIERVKWEFYPNETGDQVTAFNMKVWSDDPNLFVVGKKYRVTIEEVEP
jgi:hypothetical protein